VEIINVLYFDTYNVNYATGSLVPQNTLVEIKHTKWSASILICLEGKEKEECIHQDLGGLIFISRSYYVGQQRLDMFIISAIECDSQLVGQYLCNLTHSTTKAWKVKYCSSIWSTFKNFVQTKIIH